MEGPSDFDVVVVGTGLTESIFAGACARVGKRVLHLDHNSRYGARQTTFALKDFAAWLRGDLADGEDEQRLEHEHEQHAEPPVVEQAGAAPSERVPVTSVSDTPRRVSYIGEPGVAPAAGADGSAASSAAGSPAYPSADLLARSARFNVDVTPQLLRCGGPMVEALRSSGVASYLEFKPIGLHAYADGGEGGAKPAGAHLRRVPCAKGDIFASSGLSLMEKRTLMKFLQSCAALQPTLEPHLAPPPQAAAAPDAPPTPPPDIGESFAAFCDASRLTSALRDIAVYAILHHPGRLDAPGGGPRAHEGIVDVCRHMRSLGTFGPTAYLAPFYGTSELPQAFCRLCAVWGGTYMLARRAYGLRECGGEATAVADASGRWISCRWVLLNADSRLGVAAGGRTGGAAGAAEGADAADGAGATDGAGMADGAGAALLEVARCVAVLDGPLLGKGGEELAFASLLPGADAGPSFRSQGPVFSLQLDSSAAVCPRGTCLLHLSAEAPAGSDPREVLEGALAMFLRGREAEAKAHAEAAHAAGGTEAGGAEATAAGDAGESAAAPCRVPRVLWGAFFSLPLRTCAAPRSGGGGATGASGLRNVLLCDDARLESTCDGAVTRAKALFERVCPGAPFLPPMEEEEEAR